MPAPKQAGIVRECRDSVVDDFALVGGGRLLIGDIQLVTTHKPDPQHDAWHPHSLRAAPARMGR